MPRLLIWRFNSSDRRKIPRKLKLMHLNMPKSKAFSRSPGWQDRGGVRCSYLQGRRGDSVRFCFLNEGFDKCISQVANLKGFAEGFDRSHLDPSLEANLQLYLEEEATVVEPNEFDVLVDEVAKLS
ncbi:hypothetical protein Salat_0219800 [Sesamum alatum]|uniref:Uncharacterized protein n=1 Tax=Sesamum alatum TaxID=300844 RepID=A0AAE1YYZ3_9LAMI|nr:hypothetical protein Salat_0219800 [Sesamum alatum]